jgi:hypothetical protein
MKIHCVEGLSLGMRDAGPLMPWLGPALRGVVAARLKDRVCRLSAAERQRQGAYCKGCARMAGCPYGETFEPDVPLSLLPWMLWAGRLHAGGHRVAGAGGWRLVLE